MTGDFDRDSPPLVAPGPALTEAEAQRFSRHVILPGIGTPGQRRLKNAKVLVVGAGGLGSPALLYLAAAGVGTLGVVDDDVVDVSNLQRQVIHRVEDVGRAKVDSARDAIARLNPLVDVVTHPARLDRDNALDLLSGYDFVLDGADNFATRYLVADACEILRLPCVWGSILRFDGQVSVFWAGRGAVYRDIFPDPPDPALVPSCAQAGVLGVLCASIGAAMGTEAVKLITGVGRPLIGRLLVYDALEASWHELRVRPDPSRAPVTALSEYPAACLLPDEAALPSITASKLAQLLRRPAGENGRPLEDPPVVLVDVREPAEHELTRIEGARLVPKDDILSGRVDLPRDRPLVLHCASGIRSAQVLHHLLSHGYTDVRHLQGGIEAWHREGAGDQSTARGVD